MLFQSLAFTHPGHVRKINEDSFYASDQKKLWIVCDGMGGHQEGNFASRLVTDMFEELQLHGSFEEKIQLMSKLLELIHQILIKKVAQSQEKIKIGTTIILLFVEGENAVCIHSGDSRCYNLRDDILSTITKDHAIEIDDFYGKRKVLTSAVCAPGDLKLEITKFTLQTNDVFLLCSDGLYDNVSSMTIKSSMEDELLLGIEKLQYNVLLSSADDNITAIMVKSFNEHN